MNFLFSTYYILIAALLTLTPLSQAYKPLINSDGSPNPTLTHLFHVLKLNGHTIEEMNQTAQKHLLRKPGQERAEMTDDVYEAKRAEIYPLLEELGVVNSVTPSPQMTESATYVCLHGSTVPDMKERLKFFLEWWKHFSPSSKADIQVVFFAGDRPLWEQHEGREVLLDSRFSRADWRAPAVLPTTEGKAAEFLWDQMVSDETLRQKISFVHAPLKADGKRPTTSDTIIEWIKSSSIDLRHSHILAISSNPDVPYQDLVFINVLLSNKMQVTSLETVGPAANPETSIAVYLDSITRWLYESVKNFKLKR